MFVLTVTALDENADPVQGALIDIRDSSGTSLGVGTPTNDLGEAVFTLEQGEYQILVGSLAGYQAQPPTEVSLDQDTELGLLFLPAGLDLGTAGTDPSTSPTELDLSGIKRVRTKEMEIETHDPVKVQAARDKENSGRPCFCSLDFCVGTPKERYKRRHKNDH